MEQVDASGVPQDASVATADKPVVVDTPLEAGTVSAGAARGMVSIKMIGHDPSISLVRSQYLTLPKRTLWSSEIFGAVYARTQDESHI